MDIKKFVDTLVINGNDFYFYNISKCEQEEINIRKLPFSIRILLENVIRNYDNKYIKDEHVKNLLSWKSKDIRNKEIPYKPVRILMQDFTGVPAVVDLASMREASKALNLNPSKINPLITVDLIVDHSVQVDYYGTDVSLDKNVQLEYQRNIERYKLLKWAQSSFTNFNVVPPNAGICHQVNLENIAEVAKIIKIQNKKFIVPDTILGTDSHTPMINGLSVIGWGVGGIEAEAVLLGLPYYFSIPDVIGVKFVGTLNKGVTATDLVLNIAYILRQYGVVGKFVEYFGPALKNLSIPDRATISNMTTEYGATVDFFPVDERTIEYLKLTGRSYQAEIVSLFTKKAEFFNDGVNDPIYTDIIEVDLSKIEPTLAGPSRPHDRVILKKVKEQFPQMLNKIKNSNEIKSVNFELDGNKITLKDGSVVIAAITSCTNTSNPSVMIGAGLIAKKAIEYGLNVPAYVKTSLAPGSKVVFDYLEKTGLLAYLKALKFHIVGYGCTTCIGNSGPLRKEIEDQIIKNNLITASVLSGNRNFEARIHPSVKANFLASPMLVVLFALAGRINIDLFNEPVGFTPNGEAIFMKDLWPNDTDINKLIESSIDKKMFDYEYAVIHKGDSYWNSLDIDKSMTYKWDENSIYIQNPPYFDNFSVNPQPINDIIGARVLLLLGDTVTTDHISPAGRIATDYPAGKYLLNKGILKEDFNSYGSRRGNHNVMLRGTFGNVRIKNQLVAPKEGGYTIKFPEKEELFIYDAAEKYRKDKTPLIIIAGKEYGSGSSRDWAAKGTALLGVKAVIAESFERIHRSNLIGMGVLPLKFKDCENNKKLHLEGNEIYSIYGLKSLKPNCILKVEAKKENGDVINFNVLCDINLDVELEYYKHGGILPYTLRELVKE
jgi:aconitate hydratase